MQQQILAFGEALVEFNQTRADLPNYLRGFGGDTSNFCIAAARQGARAGFVTAVGDDYFGQLLRELWQAENVDTALVRIDPSAPTGIYFVSHDQQGHRFDYLRAGSAASRYRAHDLPHAELAGAQVLHLSGVSLALSTSACDAAFAALAQARQGGARISFDTNLRLKLWPLPRARAIMLEALRHTDICLPSWDDITPLTGLSGRDEIVDFLLRQGASVVAMKLGRDGSYIATPDERRVVPGYAVASVDATGAGDCFGGAFVARLVAGDDPFAAARYANVAAALSTTGYGAVSPIPYAAQVLRTLAD